MRRVNHWRFWAVIASLVCVGGLGAWWLVSVPVMGQAGSDGLPAGWRELPLQQFIDQARKVMEAQPPPAAELAAAIRRHSAERLRTLSQQSPAAFDSLLLLYDLGRSELRAEERTTVLAQLKPPATEIRAWDLARLHKAHDRMGQLQMSSASRESLLVGWLENRPIDETLLAGLANDASVRTGEVSWLCLALDALGPQAPSFSVRWTGFIAAPATGQYTFSTSPINVNAEGPRDPKTGLRTGHTPCSGGHSRPVGQRLAVWIDGQQVLKAEGKAWTQEAQPTMLEASQKRSLRVEFSHVAIHPFYGRVRPAIARLLWEGPGITQRPVPESSLFPPQGEGNGVLAEYSAAVDGGTPLAKQLEAQIDRVWFPGRSLAPKHTQLQRQAVDLLWSLASDPEHLSACETGAQRHVFLGLPGDAASAQAAQLLPSAQQAAWTGLLRDRANLLRSASWDSVVNVYWTSRAASPQDAVDVLGTWGQMHPEAEPAFGTVSTFCDNNRLSFQLLADGVGLQYPPHRQRLEERYLKLPAGGCSLPLAYTLSYAYLEEDRIRDWIAKLDGELADRSLGADQQVSWLLARGQVEEIRRNPILSQRHVPAISHRLLAGGGWLETATLTATSEAVRLRSYRELIARLAAKDETRATARSTLRKAAERCPQSQAALAAWSAEIDRVDAVAQQMRAAQEQRTGDAYVAALRHRHQRSVDQGDRVAATRYRDLLRAAGVEL
jgi:hypothetical protein